MPALRCSDLPAGNEETTIEDARLLTVDQLEKALESDEAANLKLVHAAAADTYADYHLPGALLVTPAELVHGAPPAPGKLPGLARLEALFGKLGYRGDETFVVYDDEGGGWAGRFAWTLDVIGHHRWAYLDGGIHAWAEAGGRLDQGPCRYPTTTRPSLTIHRGPIAEVEDVLAAMDDPQVTIWDVRSREEFLGLRSGSARAGHIPGAAHLDWMQLKDPARATRLVEDLPALLRGHGIDPGKPAITHCQTHHRSGLSYLVGRILGFPEIRAYHGSWSEWGNRDDLPVATDP